MEPVSAALLVALAGAMGSSAGEQAWVALRELVSRPFRRGRPDTHAVSGSGADEVAALVAAPGEPAQAERLAAVLAARAAEDPTFAQALELWRRTAEEAVAGAGDIHNTVSGGTQGTVVQARDIHGGVHFGTPRQ